MAAARASGSGEQARCPTTAASSWSGAPGSRAAAIIACSARGSVRPAQPVERHLALLDRPPRASVGEQRVDVRPRRSELLLPSMAFPPLGVGGQQRGEGPVTRRARQLRAEVPCLPLAMLVDHERVQQDRITVEIARDLKRVADMALGFDEFDVAAQGLISHHYSKRARTPSSTASNAGIRMVAGTPRSASDGTRTRDLRRDRPAL
jgi:hypothetical protein